MFSPFLLQSVYNNIFIQVSSVSIPSKSVPSNIVFVLQSPAYLPVYLAPGVYGRASAESSITLLLVNLLIETQVIPEHITMSVHRTFLCIFHRCMALIRRQQTAYPSGRSAVTFMYPVYGRKDRVSEHKNNILFIQFSRFNMLYYTMI